MLAADELFSVRMPFLDCLKLEMIRGVSKVTVSFEKKENKSGNFLHIAPTYKHISQFLFRVQGW